MFQGNRLSGWLIRLILVGAGTIGLMAQVDTGTISGIVTDASGASVPGAQVTITQEETNQHNTLTTNESGFYSAPGLRIGHYDVEAAHQGFQAQKKVGIQLRIRGDLAGGVGGRRGGVLRQGRRSGHRRRANQAERQSPAERAREHHVSSRQRSLGGRRFRTKVVFQRLPRGK